MSFFSSSSFKNKLYSTFLKQPSLIRDTCIIPKITSDKTPPPLKLTTGYWSALERITCPSSSPPGFINRKEFYGLCINWPHPSLVHSPAFDPTPFYYNSHAYNHTLANNHGRITLNEFKNTQHTKCNKFLKKRQTYLCTIHLPLKSWLITIKPHVALRDSPAFTKQTQTDSKATSGSTQHSATKILLKESDFTKPTLKGEHPAFQNFDQKAKYSASGAKWVARN